MYRNVQISHIKHIFIYYKVLRKCTIMFAILNTVIARVLMQDIGEYFSADNQMLRTELVEVTSTRDVATPPYYTKRSLLVKMRQSSSVIKCNTFHI